MAKKLKVVVLISGGGTTLKNLIDKHQAGEVDLDFRLVISSNPKAGGLAHASNADIPTEVIRRKDFESPEQHSAAIFSRCEQVGADYVVMGGYLQHVLIPSAFENRVLNTHPALIPSFCGKGFYGLRVHQAVLDYGAKLSGCTIHFVDNQYDHGPIILQKCVDVQSDDTAETLAARVFQAECDAYPNVLSMLANGQVQVNGRRVAIG
jgi:phosphoribosylglycinamide formyltransferase-1